jgi:hypothetical protein
MVDFLSILGRREQHQSDSSGVDAQKLG